VCNTNPTLHCWILLSLIRFKSFFTVGVCWSPMTGYLEVPVRPPQHWFLHWCHTSSEQYSVVLCFLVIHVLQTPCISFWILHYDFGLKSTWNMRWREQSSEYKVCLTGPCDCFSQNSNNLSTDSPIQILYIFIVFHSSTNFFVTSSSLYFSSLILTHELCESCAKPAWLSIYGPKYCPFCEKWLPFHGFDFPFKIVWNSC
jgi:hypothetical protein